MLVLYVSFLELNLLLVPSFVKILLVSFDHQFYSVPSICIHEW